MPQLERAALSSDEAIQGNPFDLSDQRAYAAWREIKLAAYPLAARDVLVPVQDPLHLTAREKQALMEGCERYNFAVYRTPCGIDADKVIPAAMAKQMGLRRIDKHLCVDEDGISPLAVSDNRLRQDYIPYTNKPINWHTDGYYNPSPHKICGMVLHCAGQAASGGGNALMDHEIAYLLLRDREPAYVEALMADDAMTIPANVRDGEEIRPAETGPVFTIYNGHLHMRYTARSHSIEWKQDRLVLAAVAALREIMSEDSPYILRYRLSPGEGIVCNNVLHRRDGFVNDEAGGSRRLVYRARYYDRVAIR